MNRFGMSRRGPCRVGTDKTGPMSSGSLEIARSQEASGRSRRRVLGAYCSDYFADRSQTVQDERVVIAGLRNLADPALWEIHGDLARLLLRQKSLLRHLTDPSARCCLTAINLFRKLQTLDSSLDVRLARRLPSKTSGNGIDPTFNVRSCVRALDILDETSPGPRLLSILGHLPKSENATIAARSVLFAGKRMRSTEWTRCQLRRREPEVQASAVESLWGAGSPEAFTLFEESALDDDWRVAGRGLVGLHLGGHSQALERLLDFSENWRTRQRRAAAWAMGRLDDREVCFWLRLMLDDRDSEVRGIAIQSLLRHARLTRQTTSGCTTASCSLSLHR